MKLKHVNNWIEKKVLLAFSMTGFEPWMGLAYFESYTAQRYL